MFVSNSMTARVITITEDDTIFTARDLMAKNKIRHLPVVADGDKLIGIISDRGIRSALPYDLYKGIASKQEQAKVASLKIRDIMTRQPKTIALLDTIQDALLRFQRDKVGAFPVVDDAGCLKGMISVRDLLRAFTNVLGIGEPGTLLCVLVEEKVGQMKKIVDAITEENISIGSILVARYWEENMRAVFPYLLTQNVGPVKRKLEKLGFTHLDPMQWYMDQLPQHK
ncbi:MAG: CBS domain-containing protein [Desulfobacterales bacterium]|nr:CBS domain-containing protein [Desulfobacterales bacterium]